MKKLVHLQLQAARRNRLQEARQWKQEVHLDLMAQEARLSMRELRYQ